MSDAAEKMMVSVFRSAKREEMYLFLPKGANWSELPAPLLSQFGRATHVMDLLLRPGLRLARAEVSQVMSDVREQGFYLQMPPRPELDPHQQLAKSGGADHA